MDGYLSGRIEGSELVMLCTNIVSSSRTVRPKLGRFVVRDGRPALARAIWTNIQDIISHRGTP